jgi:hypothetical protein
MGFYNPNIIRIPLETFTYKNQSDVVKVSIKNCSDVSRLVSRAGAILSKSVSRVGKMCLDPGVKR